MVHVAHDTRLPLTPRTTERADAAQRPRQARALTQVRRGLRPGSELRFYEHVIARSQPKRAILQLADRSGSWPAIGGRCHPARDTGAALEAALLTIGRCERLRLR